MRTRAQKKGETVVPPMLLGPTPPAPPPPPPPQPSSEVPRRASRRASASAPAPPDNPAAMTTSGATRAAQRKGRKRAAPSDPPPSPPPPQPYPRPKRSRRDSVDRANGNWGNEIRNYSESEDSDDSDSEGLVHGVHEVQIHNEGGTTHDRPIEEGGNSNREIMGYLVEEIGKLNKRFEALEQSQTNCKINLPSTSGQRRMRSQQQKQQAVATEAADTGHDTSSDSDTDEGETNTPLAQHLNQLTGGEHQMEHRPRSIPFHVFVETKVKKQIWKHKFIEFSKLLDKDEQPKEKGEWSIEVHEDKIRRVSKNEENLIQNLYLWDKAFFTFLSVHTVNPKGCSAELINNLLCYRQTIHDLSRNGGNWKKYDRKYRLYVHNSGDTNYNLKLHDLYDQCNRYTAGQKLASTGAKRGNWNNAGKNQSLRCHAFNKGTCFRRDCRYAHACDTCRRPGHGAFNCYRNQADIKGTSNTDKTGGSGEIFGGVSKGKS